MAGDVPVQDVVTFVLAIVGAILGLVNTAITLIRFLKERGALNLVIVQAVARENMLEDWHINEVVRRQDRSEWESEEWLNQTNRLWGCLGQPIERLVEFEFVLKNDYASQTVVLSVDVDFLTHPQAPWDVRARIFDPVTGDELSLSRPVILGPKESVSRRIEQYEASYRLKIPLEESSPLPPVDDTVLTIVTDRKTLTRRIDFDKSTFLPPKLLPGWVHSGRLP